MYISQAISKIKKGENNNNVIAVVVSKIKAVVLAVIIF